MHYFQCEKPGEEPKLLTLKRLDDDGNVEKSQAEAEEDDAEGAGTPKRSGLPFAASMTDLRASSVLKLSSEVEIEAFGNQSLGRRRVPDTH